LSGQRSIEGQRAVERTEGYRRNIGPPERKQRPIEGTESHRRDLGSKRGQRAVEGIGGRRWDRRLQ
jgi:hypothetical protein